MQTVEIINKKCRERTREEKVNLINISFFLFSGTTPGTCSPPTEEEDASVLRARLDAECQQLARDLQAAVRELVRPEPGLNLVGAGNHANSSANTSGTACSGSNGIVNNSSGSGRARAMDEIHDYSEIYTPSGDKQDGLPFELSQPPPPPMHRYVFCCVEI